MTCCPSSERAHRKGVLQPCSMCIISRRGTCLRSGDAIPFPLRVSENPSPFPQPPDGARHRRYGTAYTSPDRRHVMSSKRMTKASADGDWATAVTPLQPASGRCNARIWRTAGGSGRTCAARVTYLCSRSLHVYYHHHRQKPETEPFRTKFRLILIPQPKTQTYNAFIYKFVIGPQCLRSILTAHEEDEGVSIAACKECMRPGRLE